MPTSPAFRAGKVTSLLAGATVATIGIANLLHIDPLMHAMQKEGFSTTLATPIGVLALTSACLYLLPRTAMLGAILITAYLGGAICVHFRLGEFASLPELISLTIGIATWGGLYMRDPGIRSRIPIQTIPAREGANDKSA